MGSNNFEWIAKEKEKTLRRNLCPFTDVFYFYIMYTHKKVKNFVKSNMYDLQATMLRYRFLHLLSGWEDWSLEYLLYDNFWISEYSLANPASESACIFMTWSAKLGTEMAPLSLPPSGPGKSSHFTGSLAGGAIRWGSSR